jgi:predicted nucleic acid-binding protein
MIVFLDTGVLGLITNPNDSAEARDCKRWFEKMVARSANLFTSEICVYEAKRGLLLNLKQGKEAGGLQNLERLREDGFADFLPVTEDVSHKAAEIWAQAKFENKPLDHPEGLSADSIICAHWELLNEESPGQFVIVATTNVKHIRLFAKADVWRNISF